MLRIDLALINVVNLALVAEVSDAYLSPGQDALLAQRDDRAIKDEGLDSLTEEELRSACRARGMRAPFGEGAVRFMRRQMTEWLDLSLNRCESMQRFTNFTNPDDFWIRMLRLLTQRTSHLYGGGVRCTS